MWVIGGFIGDEGGAIGEIWYSSDGINWEQAPPFFGRSGHAECCFQE
ncbi:MAG: hypothetical protein U5K72_08070 [Balneolaceae bacterium]|nr:hypothetical protein [Balneolaceae bacterium]